MKDYKEKVCIGCTGLFKPSSGAQKYCVGCLTFKCELCGVIYKTRPAEMKITRFCSRNCQNKVIGQNVDRKKYMTDEVRGKISKTKMGIMVWGGKRKNMDWMYGENNHNWKGEDVSYNSLHSWIRRSIGKALVCSSCGSSGGAKGCHWANKSYKYFRDTKDYISLCPSCHGTYDTGNRKGWSVRV